RRRSLLSKVGSRPGPQAVADERLGLRETLLDRLQQTALEAHAAGVGHPGEPLGEHPLRLAREVLDGAVELARQAASRLLARGADRGLELLRRRLREPRCLPRHDALELLDLPALDVGERRAEAPRRLGLLPVDLLLQLLLAALQALGELLELAA